jgi:hypothetical protein
MHFKLNDSPSSALRRQKLTGDNRRCQTKENRGDEMLPLSKFIVFGSLLI